MKLNLDPQGGKPNNVNANNSAPAGTQAAPAAPAAQNQGVTAAEASSEAIAPVEEYGEDVLCSMSDKIAFICALGDPSKDDSTTVMKNGTETKKHTPTIVGYCFKALADIEVPDCGGGAMSHNDLMTYTDLKGTKQVKSGEEFYLTKFETGLLMCKPEINARISGGENEVQAIYSKKSKNKGGIATTDNSMPTVSLKGITCSIKDIPMKNVLEFTETVTANGAKRKVRKIIPGFEKWENLCKTNVGTSRGSTSAAGPKKTRHEGAKSFQAMVEAKARLVQGL